MKKHMIHALRTHAKRTLAAAFAAAFALGSALTLSACSGKPAKQTGSNSTPVPQTGVPTISATVTPAPAETATPFIDPTDPPATPVPVVGEYTKPCQKVKVDFPATELSRAFSVTFDLPEGWTVRSDEGVYTDSSYSDFGFNLHGRKLLYDENGNLAGAVGFHSYGAEGYAEYGYREAFAPFALGHVKYRVYDIEGVGEDKNGAGGFEDPLEEDPVVQIMKIVALYDHLDQLIGCYKGQDHTGNR